MLLVTSPQALAVSLLVLAAGVASASWEWKMVTKERETITVRKSDQGGVRLGLDGAGFYNILTDDEARAVGRALLEAAGEKEKKYCEECGFKAPYHFQPAELCPPGMTYKCGGVCL